MTSDAARAAVAAGAAIDDGTRRRAIRRQALKGAALTALAIGVAGGLATDIGPWYAALKKPAWQPPDWAFGPVWTLIYAFSVWSAVVAWGAGGTPAWRRWYVAMWLFNGLVNILWSVLFFRLQRPDWALVEVAMLWASIAVLIVLSARASARAAWLLLPYLLWVSVAAVLNASVVQLNAPFGR